MKKILLLIFALTAPALADIAVTPGVGKTVHTDTVNALEYQYIKVIDGTTGGTSSMTVTAAGAAKVDGSAVTQPVSGTFWPTISTITTNGFGQPVTSTYTVVSATSPIEGGRLSATSLPTAVSNAVLIAAMGDKFGRTVSIADCPRDLIISTGVVLTASTSETVLLSSGAASVFDDALAIVITNSSATGSLITLRTNGNGTTSTLHFYAPPTDTRGFTLPHVWAQGTAAANWTVQSSASVSSILIDAEFCQNK